jgi:GntR family transcriptional regulator
VATENPRNLLGSGVPLHHQIYLHLRSEIIDGAWAARDDFPGEAELARQFGVSVITTQKALKRLADDGMIERARGRRTRVLLQPAKKSPLDAPEIIPTRIGAPRPFTYKILKRGMGVAPSEACEAYGMPAGSELWLCSRLRSYHGRPHSVTLNVQSIEVGERLPVAKLRKEPMFHVLREAGFKFFKMTRRVSATTVPSHIARHLNLTLNEPTLVYTFTHQDADDGVIQWVRIWVRHDEPSPQEVFSYDTGAWTINTTM